MAFLKRTPLLLILVSALLVACGPMSKQQFVNDYDRFMQDVKEDYQDYEEDDWEEKNEELNTFLEENYPAFEDELTGEEKGKIWAKVVTYHVYQLSTRAESHWEANEEEYIALIEQNAEFLEESGNILIEDVLPELQELAPQIEQLGKGFMEKLKKKGTLDKLQRSAERWAKELEKLEDQ